MKDLPKAYNPHEVESEIYERWERSGFFNPDNLDGKPYTITMPPPNVTGTLHIGHALMATMEDILIRWRRMQGYKTLWLPGTDHAAIATQSKVETDLYKKEGKTRYDLEREEFLNRVEEFAQNSQNTILSQLKKMGSSTDWSRLAYTLDEPRSLAVRTAFKELYELELIYRGRRVVNWDPKMQTTVSDDEIEWKEETAPLYYLKYGPFTIATARPETKFGDKYVVMHPDDRRYRKYKQGDKIEVEWINGKITATIIKDPIVDMEFGTGTMTITPWHDTTDFEIAQRHKLDSQQIIDERGLLLPIAGEFAGEHIKKTRPRIVEKLKAKGLLEKIDKKYRHRIATNSRGGGIIEPQIKLQWFVDVNKEFRISNSEFRTKLKLKPSASLKQVMKQAIKSGAIRIIPQRFEKIYFHWIENLRDWCISRQIWYGHRIPVWYRPSPSLSPGGRGNKGEGEIHVDTEPPKGGGWAQDPDTLDTWFSSGLWTFSTLGWPKNTKDLKTFHPTDVLETGYDILFFWVARMILMSTTLLEQIPFKTVFLHGLVRDAEKQKMNKSKGNVIDPLEMTEKYGTDALRFALIFNTAPGTDMAFSEDKIRGMKHFANKLWNIARFVITNLEIKNQKSKIKNSLRQAKTPADKDILAKLNTLIKSTTKNLEKFNLHEAAQAIYRFTWHEFADKYIESSKGQLQDEKTADNTRVILLYCLTVILKLLHPFMPFITEHIWSMLTHPKNKKDLLIIQSWPSQIK